MHDDSHRISDAAVFSRTENQAFIHASLRRAFGKTKIIWVSTADLDDKTEVLHVSPGKLGLHELVHKFRRTQLNILKVIGQARPNNLLVVDLSWALASIDSNQLLLAWRRMKLELSENSDTRVVTVYNPYMLLDDHIQSVISAHPWVLSPSTVCENPFWIPNELLWVKKKDQQFVFLLGRMSPDYSGIELYDGFDREHARGANPEWTNHPEDLSPLADSVDGWQVKCLGPLEIQLNGSKPVIWQQSGGAAKKTRTLFAYLIQAGTKGVHAERIGELLWPAEGREDAKKNRLHHTIAMLRKCLGGKNFVERSGEFYRLVLPAGSFVDVSSFEPACRRGLALAKQGKESDALKIYLSAADAYRGDLFEDVPIEYVNNELDDWCLPRRRWLREMAIKLFCDISIVLRTEGREDESLDYCLRALSIDPASERANIEAMRVFHAQDRFDALIRQYRQFLSSSASFGSVLASAEIHRIYTLLAK